MIKSIDKGAETKAWGQEMCGRNNDEKPGGNKWRQKQCNLERVKKHCSKNQQRRNYDIDMQKKIWGQRKKWRWRNYGGEMATINVDQKERHMK